MMSMEKNALVYIQNVISEYKNGNYYNMLKSDRKYFILGQLDILVTLKLITEDDYYDLIKF